ncbi:MAG: DUF1844 domain-containing protein [Methylacidiphilales bacterium]|nr:DUF1844 domain-containing protein [Candidatus Methylacidiphilales bacterium]MDW8349626.1 DUF1844 domain-containing protein [Verrucomicrobiae bacterium]
MSELSAREISQRFRQFVMMQAQNILYVLGRVAGPDGVAPPPNLSAAKLLIDQLEMIEAKTKGNLSHEEAALLSNVLSEVRLVFVEASGGISPGMIPSRSMPDDEGDEEEPRRPTSAAPKASSRNEGGQAPISPQASSRQTESREPSSEFPSRRKFFKSYG